MFEDDIDDARDGIRAVGGRRTAGDDVHAFDEHRRDQRQIDCAALGVRHDAPRIDERQRACAEERIQAAQVRELRADVEVADADVGLGKERRVLRHRACDVANVDQPEILDLLGVDRGHGLRRIETAARDARAGDDDFFGRRLLGTRELRASHRGGDCRGQSAEGTATRAGALETDLGSHGSFPLASSTRIVVRHRR